MNTLHLYIASCVENGGIFHYVRRRGGAWAFSDRVACDRPMYFDVDGDVMHVLLRAPFPGSGESGLADCPILPDHSLGSVGPVQSTRGAVACHLCHLDGRIYVTNYISGSVFSSTGALDTHRGRGEHPVRQEAPHTHFISPTPDGQYLMSTDLGLDTVWVYDRDLKIVSFAKVPAGHGCRHLACAGDGRTVYCANELASTVSVFDYHDGTLTLTDTVETLEAPDQTNTAAAIRVYRGLVYVSQRGRDAVSVLRPEGKSLRLKGVYPCGGSSPRDFFAAEDQLIGANENSDSVSFLRIRGESLEDTGERLFVAKPLCAAAVPE
ncbi:MAG: beta-propeller fold lactonase family protein [Clostridia bacterium]|nr:beta-propeller fold lactonase family protein [Clostridia bacterium]